MMLATSGHLSLAETDLVSSLNYREVQMQGPLQEKLESPRARREGSGLVMCKLAVGQGEKSRLHFLCPWPQRGWCGLDGPGRGRKLPPAQWEGSFPVSPSPTVPFRPCASKAIGSADGEYCFLSMFSQGSLGPEVMSREPG